MDTVDRLSDVQSTNIVYKISTTILPFFFFTVYIDVYVSARVNYLVVCVYDLDHVLSLSSNLIYRSCQLLLKLSPLRTSKMW